MMKGALVELVSAIGGSVPNVVIFQFNPETLRHSFSQAAPATSASGRANGNALAVAGVPGETFSFTLAMDVTDQFADPDPAVRIDSAAHGIYPRLAALELLLYPAGAARLPTGSPPAAAPGRSSRPTPAAQLPAVLFVWGAGRIVPVRLTSLAITEKLFDAALNPTHADAQIELRVLTPDELRAVPGALGGLASAAYTYSQGQRVARAAANLGASARAVIGILGDKHLLP